MISWVTGCRPNNWIPFPPGTAVFFLPHNPLHLLSLGRQLDNCTERVRNTSSFCPPSPRTPLHTTCSNFEKYSSRCTLLLTLITHNFCLTGSHDSASYSITSSSGIAPDALPFVRRLAKVFGPLVRRFVFNWSVTQHASVKEQLHCGVRFVFDKFKLQFNVILICMCFQTVSAGGMQVFESSGFLYCVA